MPEAKSMPVFLSTPEQDERRLEKNVEEGFQRKVLPYIREEELPKYRERLRYETELINKKGYAGYFLMVQDIIVWSKHEGHLVGPSRGSVGGSLLAFCLDITEVEPIKANLLFERFLDPERDSMPDIDIDFPRVERHLVREYLENKYGKFNISSVGTLNTLGVKQTLRDLCRGLNISRAESDQICNIIEGQWDQVFMGQETQWDKIEVY